MLLLQSLPDDAPVNDVDPMNLDLFRAWCQVEALIRQPSKLS